MRMSSAVVFGVSVAAVASSPALGQSGTRFEVVPKASLVWWQIDPHYNHLWATTCPDDPSWQPGEGRSPDFRYVFDPKFGDAGVPAKKIPLYERGPVRELCRAAVSGAVVVRDTTSWSVSAGFVRVAADSLVTGLNMRDEYAHRALFETHDYPEIRFRIDSLTNVAPARDHLRGTIHGVFELRGVQTPVSLPVRMRREGEALRVEGQTQFPAQHLLSRYGMSRMKLGLGVAMRRWESVHWGVDLMLQRIGS